MIQNCVLLPLFNKNKNTCNKNKLIRPLNKKNNNLLVTSEVVTRYLPNWLQIELPLYLEKVNQLLQKKSEMFLNVIILCGGAGFEAWWLSHMYTWSTCDWWLWWLSDEPSKSVQLSKSCVVVSFIPKRSPRDLNAYFSVTWKRITPVKLPDPPFPTVSFDSFLMPLSPLKAIPLAKREHVLYFHGSCSHIYGHICI